MKYFIFALLLFAGSAFAQAPDVRYEYIGHKAVGKDHLTGDWMICELVAPGSLECWRLPGDHPIEQCTNPGGNLECPDPI